MWRKDELHLVAELATKAYEKFAWEAAMRTPTMSLFYIVSREKMKQACDFYLQASVICHHEGQASPQPGLEHFHPRSTNE